MVGTIPGSSPGTAMTIVWSVSFDHLVGAHEQLLPRQASAFRANGRGTRSSAPYQAAVLISTFLTCAGAGFGTVTLSTPFEMLALIASGSVPAGSLRGRGK